MSLLRRFAAEEQAKVQRMADVPESDDPGIPDDTMPDGEPASAPVSEPVAPEPGSASGPGRGTEAIQASPPRRSPHPVLAAAVAPADGAPSLSVRQSLMVLKSLAPVLRAALVYPGADATAAEVGQAVGRMATATAAVAKGLAGEVDMLEIDGAWATRILQEVAADWVSHHWVGTAIRQGFVVDHPEAPVEMFLSMARRLLAQPWPIQEGGAVLETSENAAVQMSFLKAFGPVAVEIESYAEVVNRRLESTVVDAEALQQVLGQALMEQALQARQLLTTEDAGGRDDQRMLLQACLVRLGSLYQAAWEPTRGDALGRLVDSASAEEARNALAGEGFEHGFPVKAYRARTTEAAKRLIGTTQAAMEMIAPHRDPQQVQEG